MSLEKYSDCKGKVAIITGASRGIGAETAKLFSEVGFEVIGLSSKELNLGSQESVAKCIAQLIKSWGRVDVLVNCAAVYDKTDTLNISEDGLMNQLAINVGGALYCSQSVIPTMVKQKSGAIVNVSSIAGRLYSKTLSVAYTASKYALIGLTRQMAAEFGPMGIRVNAVAPAQVLTDSLRGLVSNEKLSALSESVPLKRLCEPYEVAESILFLSQSRSSYVNGAVLDVNGGLL